MKHALASDVLRDELNCVILAWKKGGAKNCQSSVSLLENSGEKAWNG